MAEHQLISTGLLTPTASGLRSSDSLDSVSLARDMTKRVTSSQRVPTTDDATGEITRAVRDLLTGVRSTLGELPAAPLQSAVVLVRERRRSGGGGPWRFARVLARLETNGGPVLVGTARAQGSGAGTSLDLPAPQLPRRLPAEESPYGWENRPLLLAPPVAAQVVVGAWLAVTSSAARERLGALVNRRILPALTLFDLPSEHPPGGLDDAGHSVDRIPVIEDGRLRDLPRDPDTGLVAGRAVWDHDAGQCVRPPLASLCLMGPGDTAPPDAMELAWCVEGLQRYHPDGVLRLACLARVADEPTRWFRLHLRGKPQRLLQAVRGLTGPAHAIHTDHTVTTAALVLPSARALAEKGMGTVADS